MSDINKVQIYSLMFNGLKPCKVMKLIRGQKGGHEGTTYMKINVYNYVANKHQDRVKGGDAIAALFRYRNNSDGDRPKTLRR